MRLDHLLSMETMLREDLNGDFESGTFSLVMLFGFEGSGRDFQLDLEN